MIALDATFLLDYLDGESSAADYLGDHAEKPFFAPTLALFETYRGAARVAGAAGIERVVADLDWVEPLPFEEAAAREAAKIESELLDAGQPINLGDVLIAGVCRLHGATLVTRDEDFDAIDGLETDPY